MISQPIRCLVWAPNRPKRQLETRAAIPTAGKPETKTAILRAAGISSSQARLVVSIDRTPPCLACVSTGLGGHFYHGAGDRLGLRVEPNGVRGRANPAALGRSSQSLLSPSRVGQLRCGRGLRASSSAARKFAHLRGRVCANSRRALFSPPCVVVVEAAAVRAKDSLRALADQPLTATQAIRVNRVADVWGRPFPFTCRRHARLS